MVVFNIYARSLYHLLFFKQWAQS